MDFFSKKEKVLLVLTLTASLARAHLHSDGVPRRQVHWKRCLGCACSELSFMWRFFPETNQAQLVSAQPFSVEVEFSCCWCCTGKHLQCKQRGGISVSESDLYFPQSAFFKHRNERSNSNTLFASSSYPWGWHCELSWRWACESVGTETGEYLISG